MNCQQIGCIVLCFIAQYGVLSFTTLVPAFTGWPNAVTSYRGDNVTLKWTLNQAIVYSNSISVEFWYEKPSEVLICSWSGGNTTIHYGREYNASMAKPRLEEGSDVITLSLYNLQPDAAKYNYKCKIHVGSHTTDNTMAWIILYGVPTVPVITSSTNKLVVHTNVTLTCSAKSTTTTPNKLPVELKPTTSLIYTWETDNITIEDDNKHTMSGPGDANLTIHDLQVEDNGQTYTCKAQETGSKFSSFTDKKLLVMFKPGNAEAVKSSIGPYFEGYQSEIKLACLVTNEGNPVARFNWTRNGVVKAVTNSSTYSIAAGNLSAVDHNGIWQCTPFNEIGSGKPASINLTVYGKPAFAARPQNKTVRSDMLYALDVLCSVKGTPAPQVTWQYENGSLPDGVTVSRVADIITHDGLTVVGKRLIWSKNSTELQRRTSSGVYVCTGVIDNEEISEDVTIDVQYKPGAAKADPKQVGPYFEHHPADVRLACKLNDSGHPAARMEWIRQGVTTADTEGNTFIIPSGNLSVEDHDGYWRCTPYNVIGRGVPDKFEVLVYVKPKILIMTNRTTANAEVPSDLSVVCSVSGRPAPIIKWQYKGGALPEAVVVENDTDVSNGYTVTVSSRLTWSDTSSLEDRRKTSGVYTCFGKVGDQETRHNVDVDVHFAPYNITILPPGNNISRVENEDLRLSCGAICSPNCNYTWIKDGVVVSRHGMLQFQSIDRDDRGTYTCKATNGPSEETNVHIEVLSPPFEPENFRVTIVKPHYIMLQWTTGYNGGFNQSFTIKYMNVATGHVLQTPPIADAGENSSYVMEYNITEGIQPATRYELEIYADNSQGRTIGEAILIATPAMAKFVDKPVIVLVKSHARILFVISGMATRVKVENCVEETATCAAEDVVVPERRREPTDSSAAVTQFLANVDLADPSGTAFFFKFWIYDGSELVHHDPVIVVARKSSSADRILKVVAILVVFLVIVLIIILLIRFRRSAKREKQQLSEKKLESGDEGADETTKLLPDEDPESALSRNAPDEIREVDDGSAEKKVHPVKGQAASSVEPLKDHEKKEEPKDPTSVKSSKDQQIKDEPKAPTSLKLPEVQHQKEELEVPTSVKSPEDHQKKEEPKPPTSGKSSKHQQKKEPSKDETDEPKEEPDKQKVSRLSQLLRASGRFFYRAAASVPLYIMRHIRPPDSSKEKFTADCQDKDVVEQGRKESDGPMQSSSENSEVKVDIPENVRKLSVSQSNEVLASPGKEEAKKGNRKSRSATRLADPSNQHLSESPDSVLEPADGK